MAAKLDHRNRRMPAFSFILMLISLVTCLVTTSFFSFVSLIKDSLQAEVGALSLKLINSSLHTSTIQNALIFSTLFVFVIMIMMLYKAKSWAYSIPAFFASILNFMTKTKSVEKISAF